MKKNITISIAILAVVIFLYQSKDFIYSTMDDWKLIPRPERFTELYFEDHINLPKQIQKGEQISFSFAIHNLEGEKWTYPYIVYFKSLDGQVIEIENASVSLGDGETEKIDEVYTSQTDNNRGAIFVELKNPAQNIDFLLNYND